MTYRILSHFILLLVIILQLTIGSAHEGDHQSSVDSFDSTDFDQTKETEHDLGTNLTFMLSGSNLPTQDRFSPVDALVKLYHKIGRSGAPTHFGTTDHVMNDPNPEWPQVFSFIWKEGTGQKWHFVLRDHDILDRDDDVGDAVVDVDKYVEYGQSVNVTLSHGGFLIIKATTPIYFRIWADNLPNKDNDGGTSDPYVEFYWRRGKNGTTNFPFGTTEVMDNDENPTFKFESFEFPNWQPGTNQYFYFRVYDKDTITRDDLLGDLLLEVDSFVEKKVTSTSILNNSDNKASLSITSDP